MGIKQNLVIAICLLGLGGYRQKCTLNLLQIHLFLKSEKTCLLLLDYTDVGIIK